MLMIPPIPHMSREKPTLCVASSTPLGEMKIPEPRWRENIDNHEISI
jgi:hypothetical protein